MASNPDRSPQGIDRWPSLLVALRRATRPDRARVAAYVGLVQRQAGWDAYFDFLSGHRAWTDALDRALSQAGAPHRPLRDGPATSEPGEELAVPRTRAQALGCLYVLEAFRLGRAVLARRIRGRSESAGEREEADRAWSEMVLQLESVPVEEHGAVLQAARDAFAQWERRLGSTLARLGLSPAPGARAA